MTKNIKVLDCTLRDGGYINNWCFGNNSDEIISSLLAANIDFIETGFITTEKSESDQTLFYSFDKIKSFLPQKYDKNKLVGMISLGEFPVEFVPDEKASPICGIRVIFKKEQIYDALEYCKIIKQKGYKLFINPTFISLYSDEEFIQLLQKIKEIKPYAFSIVDSMGVTEEKDIVRLFKSVDKNLEKEIALCFHSHNNLQLSFSNAQALLKICKNRELIIDSSLFGMGRGAGNLCTEIITQHINDNYNGNYQITPLLKVIDKNIKPIFEKTPWGYSIPYFLSAKNHCHPNYAKYLKEKNISYETMDKLLSSIPEDKKSEIDINLIEQIYQKQFATYMTC